MGVGLLVVELMRGMIVTNGSISCNTSVVFVARVELGRAD